MYQLLSKSAEFCTRCEKNILAYLFLGHGAVVHNLTADKHIHFNASAFQGIETEAS